MRKKIVAGNWKMNLDLSGANSLIDEVINQLDMSDDTTCIFIPPFPFLNVACEKTKNSTSIFVGAQNCSEHEKGAYTGEVSSLMLRSLGCSYVLVGHSERRAYFSESAEQLIQKIERALAANLKVIYCFGEELKDRKNNTHFKAVKKQLEEVLQYFPKEKLDELILAYEPVWAIGTGETASPEQAQEMHAFVRTEFGKLFTNQAAEHISILYGGSCNAKNAKELFACKDVDGGLIGGASLIANDFCAILKSF